MDVFGRKARAATRRAEFLQELPKRMADNPHKAYLLIEDRLAFVIQNDTPDFLGPRYTEVWVLYVNHLTTSRAIAERATRIERLAELQPYIAGEEKMLAQIANGTYDFGTWEYCEGKRGKRNPPWSQEDHAWYVKELPIASAKRLAQFKEQLMAAKYGPINWPVKEREHDYYDTTSVASKTAGPGMRPLTPEEIETAVKELDRR